jgi:hypothetical protein
LSRKLLIFFMGIFPNLSNFINIGMFLPPSLIT